MRTRAFYPSDLIVSRWAYRLFNTLLLVSLLSSGRAHAAAQSADAVMRATTTWVRSVTADARPDASVDRIEAMKSSNGRTYAFVAYLEDEGFCICGADDLSLPVYFYSPRGRFDVQNPNYRFILWDIERQLQSVESALRAPGFRPEPLEREIANRAQYWQALAAARVPPDGIRGAGNRTEPDMLVLNVTTHWHQGDPYNNECPMGDGGRCLVGCVATAGAMVLKYWGRPPAGYSFHSYAWDGDQSCGGNTSGDYLTAFYNDDYEWDAMPDDCSGGCTAEQEAALAELCYEVGVSVDMNYGCCGSGAFESDFVGTLDYYFLYDSDVTFMPGVDIARMTAEIAWLRPMIMGGQDYQGPDNYRGHAWVVHGYNKATDPYRQFWMNMGWGGGGDGWYSCNNIDVDLDGVPDFWDDQDIVLFIAPESVHFVDRYSAAEPEGDGSPSSPYNGIEEAIIYGPAHMRELVFESGSVHHAQSYPLQISRAVTLRGQSALIE